MNKPTILKIKEMQEKLIKTINESNVPAFTITPIIEKILAEVKKLEQIEYEQEKSNYEKILKERKENK